MRVGVCYDEIVIVSATSGFETSSVTIDVISGAAENFIANASSGDNRGESIGRIKRKAGYYLSVEIRRKHLVSRGWQHGSRCHLKAFQRTHLQGCPW